jgi:hypothetical protein
MKGWQLSVQDEGGSWTPVAKDVMTFSGFESDVYQSVWKHLNVPIYSMPAPPKFGYYQPPEMSWEPEPWKPEPSEYLKHESESEPELFSVKEPEKTGVPLGVKDLQGNPWSQASGSIKAQIGYWRNFYLNNLKHYSSEYAVFEAYVSIVHPEHALKG